MNKFEIYQGAAESYPLQIINRGGLSDPAFHATDTFTAYIYRGQDQTPLFAPMVTFFTNNGAQTGYDQGQVLLSITAAQSATLEAAGTYYGLIWWTQQTQPVASFTLSVKPAAGTATQAITPYCTYQDMLFHADWIELIQRKKVDQEGFYSQRLQARQWLDKIIIGAWMGTGLIPFGDPMYPAAMWSGGSYSRTTMTSQWLRNALAGGIFYLGGIAIVNRGSGYRAPLVTAPAPTGVGAVQATFTASVDGSGRISAVFLTNAGANYLPGTLYNLTVTDSFGSGAVITATTTTGALLVRPEVVRACAFKAISFIGLGQLGGAQYASWGQHFASEADREVLDMTAELDLAGTGLGQVPIPLGNVNVFYV